jgi:hypothetical protein
MNDSSHRINSMASQSGESDKLEVISTTLETINAKERRSVYLHDDKKNHNPNPNRFIDNFLATYVDLT